MQTGLPGLERKGKPSRLMIVSGKKMWYTNYKDEKGSLCIGKQDKEEVP